MASVEDAKTPVDDFCAFAARGRRSNLSADSALSRFAGLPRRDLDFYARWKIGPCLQKCANPLEENRCAHKAELLQHRVIQSILGSIREVLRCFMSDTLQPAQLLRRLN